jgi:hypothetical protein
MRVRALVLIAVAAAVMISPRVVLGAATSSAVTPSAVTRIVAGMYGEHHPRIIHLERTTTETGHQPMYFIGMSGHFTRGRKHAGTIYFSALAARWHVWGLAAYDTQHHLLWTQTLVPRPGGHS